MKCKRILTETEEKEIITKYQTDCVGIETLCDFYNVGKLKIKGILLKNNVVIKNKGGQKINGNSKEIEISKICRYISNDKKLIAKCKKTGVIINDPNNLSGFLTSHIIKEYGDVPIPRNTYQRKKYEIEYGKKWFEEYFDIIETDIVKMKKCPYCNWETKDIKNLSGQFQLHLINEHNLSIEDYLKEFPEELDYFNMHRKSVELSKIDNHVICEICGLKLKYLTNTHLRKHNISLFEYKLRFPNSPIISKNYKNNLIKTYNKSLRNCENKFTSKPQIELFQFIENLGLKPKMNSKKLLSGIEIDIIIDEKLIGIEYNGLYYHQEKNGKPRLFHLNKTKLMNNKGYKLLHIFEDEWIENKELVKHKIKHILGYNKSKQIGARNCKISPISSDLKNIFLKKYHIQGSDKSKISLGATYKGELVGVMTFDSKRGLLNNLDSDTYELTRFATNNDYIISGLSSKMLKYFITEHSPSKIISFGDRRWVLDVNDNLYTKIGFKCVKILGPDYKYFNSKVNRAKRFHKFGFGKSSLKKKYPNLDFSKTEKELTTELGYDRIWDCGLFKYELKIN